MYLNNICTLFGRVTFDNAIRVFDVIQDKVSQAAANLSVICRMTLLVHPTSTLLSRCGVPGGVVTMYQALLVTAAQMRTSRDLVSLQDHAALIT